MNENSIGQLLTDCLRNQLIEGYTQFPEGVALWREGERRKMTREQAHEFLSGLYAETTLSSSTSSTARPTARKA